MQNEASAAETAALERALGGPGRPGDPQAFAVLVELYQRPVYNLCYRMLGNAQDAEDAAQETFLRAYKSLGRYDHSRPFSTWLLSIAAHHCIDQIRRRRAVVVSIEDLPLQDLPDREMSVEGRVGRKEEERKVRALLNRLEPTDRALVVMYYWNDLSYKEICQALNLSESAVKSRLHRARAALAAAATAQRWKEPDTSPVRAAERIEA